MSKNKVTIPDNIVGDAWNIFSKHAVWAILATLVYFLISFLSGFVPSLFSQMSMRNAESFDSLVSNSIGSSIVSILMNIAVFFLTPLFIIWFYQLFTSMIEKKDLSSEKVRSQIIKIDSSSYWNILLYYVLIYIAIFAAALVIGIVALIVGFVVFGALASSSAAPFTAVLLTLLLLTILIIPSIYLIVRLMYTHYLIIDKRYGAIKAMQSSFKITEGKFWSLFGYDLMFVGITILGFLALGVGILVAYPVIVIADLLIYRTLRQNLEEKTAVKESPV